MTEFIPGKEYIFLPREGSVDLDTLHGATFVFERPGALFADMVMGKIRGKGYAVYPDELVDPNEEAP